MHDVTLVKTLLSKENYKEAAKVLDQMISQNRDNDELWYLRAIVCLKNKAYESAHEYLERAIVINKKPEYFNMMGMVFFETLELESAIESFKKALQLDPRDINSAFLAAISYMMLDRPESSNYLNIALKINPKKAKSMLMNSYSLLIKNDQKVSVETKKKIEYEMSKF